MANTSCLNEGRRIFRHHLLLCRILQDSFKDCPLRGHAASMLHRSCLCWPCIQWTIQLILTKHYFILRDPQITCLNPKIAWATAFSKEYAWSHWKLSPSTKSPPPLHLYGLVWRTPREWGWTGKGDNQVSVRFGNTFQTSFENGDTGQKWLMADVYDCLKGRA